MRKGQQTAGNAGTLIAIITGLIILYILFLPPSERAELLGVNDSDNESDSATKLLNDTLLSESIGRVDFLKDDSFEKTIPNIFLREITSATVLAQFNPFVVRNGWFDKQEANISFSIDNLELTSNIKLIFGAQAHEGRLSINLNGNKIFEGDLQSYNVDPIPLDKSMLKQDNTLVFSVSDVGGAFWKTNEYQLDNIKVIGDVSDISGQTSSSVFVMEGFEYFNMKDAKLIFVPFCRGLSNIGSLEIYLNNHKIYSAIPLCEDRVVVSIPISHFNAGQNNIRFTTTRGAYAVEQIEIKGELKDIGGIIKYFEIGEDEFQEILDDDLIPTLVLKFVDDNERKRATINVNGHLKELDQRDPEFNWTITNYVQQDNNYVKIDPKTTLEIVSLKVVLDEK